MFGTDTVERRNHATQNKVSALVDSGTFERNDIGTFLDHADGLGIGARLAHGAQVLIGKSVAARTRVDLVLCIQKVFSKAFHIGLMLGQDMVSEATGSLVPDSRERREFPD